MNQMERFEVQISQIPIPENVEIQGESKLDKINYVSNVLKVHVAIASKLIEYIPELKTIGNQTRYYCVMFGSLEMSMVRGANNHRQSGIHNSQDTSDMSITGKGTSLTALRDIGMSGNLVDGMMDLCKALKGYEPDDIEWALLGALCLFNIDRSPAIFKPSAAERKQIDTLQETIFMILRTKMIQDGKPHRILAAYISYISQVHSFANRSISEWGKFYHYKPKIFFSNP